MSTENKGLALLKQELPQLKALIALNAKPGVNVEIMALQELEFLQMRAMTNPALLNCEPITIVHAVKGAIRNNLSLDPSAGLVYVTTRGINVGGTWKTALEATPTANGKLSINYQCGKILDHKNPEVRKDKHGKVIEVSFEYQNSRGRWEIKRWDESDFERWKAASHKQNASRWRQDSGKPAPDAKLMNYANALYTSFKGGIDPEFARAKAVKHGLQKLGTNPNEVRAEAITMIEPKKVIIDAKAEEAALQEDVAAAEEQYTPHEEVETNRGVIDNKEVVYTAKPIATEKPKAPEPTFNDLPSANDL